MKMLRSIYLLLLCGSSISVKLIYAHDVTAQCQQSTHSLSNDNVQEQKHIKQSIHDNHILFSSDTDLHIDSTITNLIAQYKRPLSLLEIGMRELPTIFSLAENKQINCVGMLLGGGEKDAIAKIARGHLNTISLLAPSNLSHRDLEKLSKCEHFDIVVIHDIMPCMQINVARVFDALIRLGDHCFISNQAKALIQEAQNFMGKKKHSEQFLYLYTPKTYLEMARFTQKVQAADKIKKYHIKSTFTEKLLLKKSLKKPTRWIEGINLVTFAMLKGVYPTDDRIRQQITTFKKVCPQHNDLVIGNMIVQGDRILPIDLADKRRSVDSSHCITAALHSFKNGNKRLVNPEKWIQSYYKNFA